jgi:hypothetical protein
VFATIKFRDSGAPLAVASTDMKPMSLRAIVRLVVLVAALAALTVAYAMDRAHERAEVAATAHE